MVDVSTDTAGSLREMGDSLIRAVYMPLYKNDGLLRIVDLFPDVSFTVARSAAELEAQLDGAEILITNNRVYDAEAADIVRRRGRSLRWIQFSTSGIERGIQFGLPPGIPVCNASGVKGPTVAEHAMTLLLASFRCLRGIEAARQARTWARHELNAAIRSLEGATLVIVGLGAIGREIARKAKAFDMRVIAVTREGKSGPTIDQTVPRSRLRDALAEADAVVLSVPVAPDTIHMIGSTELRVMKPDAVLVNVARGELVDEPALIHALREGWIGGAALDVTAVEPLPAENELWQLKNVLLSPHVAGSGHDGFSRFAALFGENLRRYKHGEPLSCVIEWEALR